MAEASRKKLPDYLKNRDKENYSKHFLLTTDLPGKFGYDGGGSSVPGVQQGGYYTDFGGTSGACGIVAGVIALIRRARKQQLGRETDGLSGNDIKAILMDTADTSGCGLPEASTLTPDEMNAGDAISSESLTYFFGAGLVNAAAAMDRCVNW